MRHLLEALAVFVSAVMLAGACSSRANTGLFETPEQDPRQGLPRFDGPPVHCERQVSEPEGAWCTPALEALACENGVAGMIRRTVRHDGACVVRGIIYPPGHPATR